MITDDRKENSAQVSAEDYGTSPIAIIGMAGRLPGAPTIDRYWQNLRSGIESVEQLSEQELRHAGVLDALIKNPDYVRSGAFLENIEQFDAGFFGISPKEADIMDPQHRQLLEVSWQALENAGHVQKDAASAVGVFVGSGYNSYFGHNVLSSPELVEQFGFFLLRHTGNDKDFLATRLSYQFGLQGPSVNVQTACSTSLVAVHMGIQSLLSGECDIALAGAVSIDLPHRTGYLYRDGEVASPDGRCRPFDSEAQGTFFGSGAGVVVLKPLAAALDDQDYVHGIIRGSAVNNDGAGKVSYLAPSVDAQAAAIAEALMMAEVDARDVSYVEAHGTGTPMGDPIEFAALNEVFATDVMQDRRCYIGSVKANIGHLDTASGIAGLIKTVEALKHQELPPSLNYVSPNPALDIESSALEINASLRPWSAEKGPRFAGVTSLGVGGTNAHVVLQEYVRPASTAEQKMPRLLPLSARSEAALNAVRQNLSDHMHQHDDLRMLDVAFTLQCGRKAHEYRSVVLAQSSDDARTRLCAESGPWLIDGKAESTEAPVCFLFAGGGAQYRGMGRRLYEQHPVYRETLDSCLSQLSMEIERDIRKQLFCSQEGGQEGGQEDGQDDKDTDVRFSLPSRALPALFATQLAQARLWQSWGIEPDVLMGHSMGEYTAACLAGVMSADTALAVVVKRAQLFETVAKGGMLSVMANVAQIQDLLNDGHLSIAAVNAPSLCVISGPVAALDAFSLQLESRDIDYRRVPIDVAAHSHMLTPILDEFAQFLKAMVFHPPTRKLISNLTGTWADPEMITQPYYWVRHLRETVSFADGVHALLADTTPLLLEVGPGATLSNLVQACAVELPDGSEQQAAELQIITSMQRDSTIGDDESQMLMSLAALWSCGQSIKWHAVQPDNKHAQKVPLPSYAFEHKRHWIEPAVHDGQGMSALPTASTQPSTTTAEVTQSSAMITEPHAEDWRTRDLSSWFATTDWVVAPLAASAVPLAKTVLLFSNTHVAETRTPVEAYERFCQRLKSRLVARACHVIDVVAGKELKQFSGSWVVDVTNEDHLTQLFSAVASASNDAPLLSGNAQCANDISVVSLLNTDAGFQTHEFPACLNQSECVATPEQRLQALLALSRALHACDQECHVTVVTSDLQQIGAESIVDPGKSVIPGALAVIAAEMPQLTLATVDVRIPTSESGATRLARTLVNDLAEQWSAVSQSDLANHSGSMQAGNSAFRMQPTRVIRQGRRFIPQLRSLSCQTNAATTDLHHHWEDILGSDPVCLITGGLGGIGYSLAQDLARAGCRRLILLGRTVLPPSDEYAQWMKMHTRDDPIAMCIHKLQVLEQLGADVLWLHADLQDAADLEASIASVMPRYEKIDALFHTAGVLDDALVVRCSESSVNRVLAPKVQGTINLDRALSAAQLKPELFVLFSSTSSSMGIAGQAAYAAANSFLCGYARYKRTVEGTQALAIAWDRWEEVGMAARLSTPHAAADQLASPIQTADGAVPVSVTMDSASTISEPVQALDMHSRIDHALFDSWSHGCNNGRDIKCVLRPAVERDWYLHEHRLADGCAVLPGTGYIALVKSAVDLATIDCLETRCNHTGAALSHDALVVEFQDVIIERPLVMDQQSQVELQVSLFGFDADRVVHAVNDASDRALDYTGEDTPGEFVVSSLASSPQQSLAIDHVRGSFNVRTMEHQSFDTASIAARCNRRMSRDEIVEHEFIDFGERWQCVTAVHYGTDEALVELQLDTRFEDDLHAWPLHPALLDMALGAASQLLPSIEGCAYIPSGYGRMLVYGSLTPSMRSHVARSDGDDGASIQSTNIHSMSFDIQVVDQHDRVLVSVEKFVLRSIPLAAVEQLKPECAISHVQGPNNHYPVVHSGVPVSLSPCLPDTAGIHPHEGLAALRQALLWQDIAEMVISPRLTAVDAPSHMRSGIAAVARSDSEAANASSPTAVQLATADELQQQAVQSTASKQLASTPLTPRSSLSLSELYAEPQSEMQRDIVRIWEKTLGIDGIGINDNFFELGGHSLLLTQTLPAIRKQCGQRLALSHAFDSPTVAQWASHLTDNAQPVTSTEPASGSSSGGVTPLPPGPARFLCDRGDNGLHQWNLAILLDSREPVDNIALKAAVADLIQRHDALRMRFIKGEAGWRADIQGVLSSIPVSRLDVSGLHEGELTHAIEQDAAVFQAGLSLEQGELLKFRTYTTAEHLPDRLLIVVHHLVHDAFSWNILLSEFQIAYAARKRGEQPAFSERPVAYQCWAEALQARADAPEFRSSVEYWKQLPWSGCAPLPPPLVSDNAIQEMNTNSSARQLTVTFGAAETDILQTSLGDQCSIDGAVLLALARSVNARSGQAFSHALVDVMQHGRDDDELDVTRTIGFFVSYSPVVVPACIDGDLRQNLVQKYTEIRHMSALSTQHDLLKYLSQDSLVRHEMAALPCADILFNFLGRRDESNAQLIDEALFQTAQEASGPTHAEEGIRAYRVAVKGGISQNGLYLTFVYSDTIDSEESIELWADNTLAELRTLLVDESKPVVSRVRVGAV